MLTFHSLSHGWEMKETYWEREAEEANGRERNKERERDEEKENAGGR